MNQDVNGKIIPKISLVTPRVNGRNKKLPCELNLNVFKS